MNLCGTLCLPVIGNYTFPGPPPIIVKTTKRLSKICRRLLECTKRRCNLFFCPLICPFPLKIILKINLIAISPAWSFFRRLNWRFLHDDRYLSVDENCFYISLIIPVNYLIFFFFINLLLPRGKSIPNRVLTIFQVPSNPLENPMMDVRDVRRGTVSQPSRTNDDHTG